LVLTVSNHLPSEIFDPRPLEKNRIEAAARMDISRFKTQFTNLRCNN